MGQVSVASAGLSRRCVRSLIMCGDTAHRPYKQMCSLCVVKLSTGLSSRCVRSLIVCGDTAHRPCKQMC